MEPKLDEDGKELPKLTGLTQVRHGQGIQIYGIHDNGLNFKSKYEGSWVKGNMHGRGRSIYENRSVYIGSMIEGKR